MAVSTRPTIRRGSSGPDVSFWQTAVGVNPDGAFGPLTEAATIQWQIKNQLTADGIVGPNTWAKLAAISEPTRPTIGQAVASVIGSTTTPGEQFVSFGALIPSLDDVRTLLGRIPQPIKVASGVIGAFGGLLLLDTLTRKSK